MEPVKAKIEMRAPKRDVVIMGGNLPDNPTLEL